MNVWEDARNPIIYSIATLRAVYPNDIIVIDSSREKINWGKLPKLYNFKLIKITDKCQTNLDKLRSRAFVIPNYTSSYKNALFSDSDVFWRLNPFPREHNPNKIVALPENNGIFYFQPEHAKEFFRQWQTTILKMYQSKEFEQEVIKNYYNNIANDEAAFIYTIKQYPELHEKMKLIENYIGLNIGGPFDPNAKNYHFAGIQGNRKNYAIWIKDFWDLVKINTPKYLQEIFRCNEESWIDLRAMGNIGLRRIHGGKF